MTKIVTVAALPGRRIHLEFEDGVKGAVNLSHLTGGVFKPFDDPGFFAQVSVNEEGTVSWPNGVDLCPGSLYEKVTGRAFVLSEPDEAE